MMTTIRFGSDAIIKVCQLDCEGCKARSFRLEDHDITRVIMGPKEEK